MTAAVSLICRYPIKSIGGEQLADVDLHPSRPVPGDRRWALLHQGGERHATGRPGQWLPKSCFLRGAKAPNLQAVRGGWDGNKLRLSHPDLPALVFDPETEADALIAWIAPLWPDDQPPATRLLAAPISFMDVNQPFVSILSQSSLRRVEDDLGQALGTDRWRANFWIDGWAPFAEFDLIGQILTIGGVELRVVERIGRCSATSANSETGMIDSDMPDNLRQHYGHSDFGVYAQVVTGGRVALGDEVSV